MATRNLTPLRLMIERRMMDTGTLTRDSQGADDDVLDQTTGVLTPPTSDSTTVYTGKALIYPTGLTQSLQPEGGRAYTEKTYTLRLPWDAAEPRVGDVWVTTTAQNDPHLDGRPLRVLQVDYSSLLTSRNMVVEDRATP